jgi:hypothetical protein
MTQSIRIALAALIFAVGCSDGSSGKKDAGPDGGDTDTQDALPHAARALILDQELRHHSTWIDVIDALELAGLEVTYRRFYPHLTAADVDAVDGEHPYAIIVLGASRYPGNPASVMRQDQIAQMRRFVEEGGALLLAPQSGWQDSRSGENDFFVQNRLLEELEVPVRIERTTILGALWNTVPTPAHEETEHGYPTPLEFMLGYPYLLTADDERIGGGLAPTLRVASDQVQALLRTSGVAYLWHTLNGYDTLSYCTDNRAVAALAESGLGFVAVVPRGTLTLSAASGSLSDKPVMDPELEAANRSWVGSLMAQLGALVSGAAELQVTAVWDQDELFSVGAANVPPLGTFAEQISIVGSVSELPVPASPPAGELVESVPDPPADPRPAPAWFSPSGGRIAYGGLTPTDDEMATAFGEIADHGIDALMTSTTPSALATLTGDDLLAEQARYAAIAAMAETAGAAWLVGDWINSEAGDYPAMVGSHGNATNVPAPLNQDFWDERVIPMYAAVGELAADNPGLTGLHLDLELYSGPIWHHDGWAFSDDSVGVFQAVAADQALADQLAAADAGDRLDLLVDNGALGDYFDALEQAAFELGCACREAARAFDEDLELMVYAPGFPNTWFYIGLLRGLGTHERPVIALTYEGWGDRPTEALYAEGVEWVHLGGTIVSHYNPEDFDDALVSLATSNDGYWYFTFNDFSSTNPEPPEMHGGSQEYWDAVDQAHSQLD